MTKRIFRAICTVAVSTFLAALLLIIGVLYGYFSDLQRQQLKMELELAAQGVVGQGRAFLQNLPADNYRITWIDAQGRVLYDSDSASAGMENHLEREEISEARQTGYGESSRYSTTLLEQFFYAAKLLPDDTVLRLAVSQSSVLQLILGMLQPICLIFLLTLVLAVLLATSSAKKIVRPLNQMDLEHPLGNKVYEEMTPLLRRINSQQQQLKKAEQLRREFTANVSHELKTPLHSISGYAELLQNGLVQPEDVQTFAGRIYTEAQRLVHLVEDIISLSHLDEGAQDLPWAEVDIFEMAQAVLQSLQTEAQAAQVRLHLSGGPTVIKAIPQLLQSIIYNLCENALKYNRPNGQVNVSVARQADKVCLTVQDTGIGIAPEHQQRIFERFYRVDKSHSKNSGGTGLGLSIVKHAVLVHNAKIELASELGQGTVVRVIFEVF